MKYLCAFLLFSLTAHAQNAMYGFSTNYGSKMTLSEFGEKNASYCWDKSRPVACFTTSSHTACVGIAQYKNSTMYVATSCHSTSYNNRQGLTLDHECCKENLDCKSGTCREWLCYDPNNKDA
ncbi:hypothetical protein BGW38_001503 [Lunasporangiospora selenospora]|uniref:Uncharacterized protein n=1 Tax=Lunasporangiospora selenospora TaxID=979761 RepID=A0A9P6KI01_9FUNG|nr:hypothetical protein BGW38_001503 [Lunasporangiospora selenospora]